MVCNAIHGQLMASQECVSKWKSNTTRQLKSHVACECVCELKCGLNRVLPGSRGMKHNNNIVCCFWCYEHSFSLFLSFFLSLSTAPPARCIWFNQVNCVAAFYLVHFYRQCYCMLLLFMVFLSVSSSSSSSSVYVFFSVSQTKQNAIYK